jgi:hypothetical protein
LSYAHTTLNLDDDVVQLLKNYASDRSIPLGTAASELVRRGLETPVQLRMVNGFYAVDLPAGGQQISSARVKELLEEEI